MVVLNNNEEERQMPDLSRFEECLMGRRSAYNVFLEKEVADLGSILLSPKSAAILEIR